MSYEVQKTSNTDLNLTEETECGATCKHTRHYTYVYFTVFLTTTISAC